MKITIREHGNITNFIECENLELAAELFPGCTVSEYSPEDEAPTSPPAPEGLTAAETAEFIADFEYRLLILEMLGGGGDFDV